MKKHSRTLRSLVVPGLVLGGCIVGTILSGCGNSSDPNSGAGNPPGQAMTLQQTLDAIDKNTKMPPQARAQMKAITIAHWPGGAAAAPQGGSGVPAPAAPAAN